MSKHTEYENELTEVVVAADTTTEGGVSIAIKAVPNASRNKIAGLLGDRLKIAVAAPPEAGKANIAICKLLAKVLGVPVRDVSVTAGHTQPLKRVHVAGADVKSCIDQLCKVMS